MHYEPQEMGEIALQQQHESELSASELDEERDDTLHVPLIDWESFEDNTVKLKLFNASVQNG